MSLERFKKNIFKDIFSDLFCSQKANSERCQQYFKICAFIDVKRVYNKKKSERISPRIRKFISLSGFAKKKTFLKIETIVINITEF